MLEQLTLLFLECLAISAACGVILISNPVHAILALILVFVSISPILILLGADYMALCFLVVYVGAIAILFLFVIMCSPKNSYSNQNSQIDHPLIVIVTFILNLELIILVKPYLKVNPNIVATDPDWVNFLPATNIEVIGQILFFFYPLISALIAILLLLAMVGSIMLTLSDRSSVRRQYVYIQNSINYSNVIRYLPSGNT